ncbi:MAG TPA: AMIN domain-containing protein, partial [Nevskiales bacterium]|nr:AMIN domain-containing protein [Nevskiales bacterium]
MMRAVWAVLVLCALPAGAAELARLQDIRLWAGPEQTRIVFDLSGPVEYSVFTLDNPERVVIDISQTRRVEALKATREGKGLVQTVRTGVQPGGNARVVL